MDKQNLAIQIIVDLFEKLSLPIETYDLHTVLVSRRETKNLSSKPIYTRPTRIIFYNLEMFKIMNGKFQNSNRYKEKNYDSTLYCHIFEMIF